MFKSLNFINFTQSRHIHFFIASWKLHNMFVSFENPLRFGIVLILQNAKQWLRHF